MSEFYNYDPGELARYLAELRAGRAPSSSFVPLETPRAAAGQAALSDEASRPSGFLGAFIQTAQFAMIHLQPGAFGLVVDAIELTAPSIGGTQTVGLYRRTRFANLPQVSAFPTGGVPLSAVTFAGADVAPPPPDGSMVLLPGQMQRRDGLRWFVPPNSGFTIAGGVGIDIAFGVYFHEVVV